MTESIAVMISPQAARLRILAQQGQKELLQALIKPMSPWALRALPGLLLSLSEYQAKPLSVVLCADESGASTLSEAFAVLRQQSENLWPVGMAVVPRKRHYGTDWDRQFDDLRSLHIEGGRS